MDTELQQAEDNDTAAKDSIKALDGSEPGKSLALLQPATETEDQWQRFGRQVSEFLAQLPEYIGRFFNEYKLPIISFALLVTVVTALRIILAIENAVNDIPLLNSLLELIGVGYTIWFIFRYLLKASTRKQLAEELNSTRKQIIGEKSSEPQTARNPVS